MRLLEALAADLRVAEAAATAGVSERTAYRRLADPLFRAGWRRCSTSC